jgi:hypothetical protein
MSGSFVQGAAAMPLSYPTKIKAFKFQKAVRIAFG